MKGRLFMGINFLFKRNPLLQKKSSKYIRNFSSQAQVEINRWDPSISVEKATTPPSSWFRNPDIYEIEKKAIFSKNWIAVGRKDQVDKPGSYFSGILGEEPYVVVRGDDGQLRAFFNVCQHHAAQLTPACGQGCVEKFVCPYHGWTYNLEGRLTQARRLRGIKDFKAKQFGLKSIQVEEFGPLIMINLDGEENADVGFNKIFNQVKTTLEEKDFNNLTWVRRVEYSMDCNWKVFVDNYLDGGYHVEYLHPDLTGLLDISSYQTTVSSHYSIQSASGVGSERVGGDATYVFMYPSLMINRYGPWMDTNMVVPTGPVTSKVIYDYYLEKDFIQTLQGKDLDSYIESSLASSDQVQQEDNAICESVQRGLASAAYDMGRYAPQVEMADHAFHQTLAGQLRSYAV